MAKITDVLLIEDNLVDADLTIRALRKKDENLSILHIEDGAEAMDYIFSTGKYSGKKFIFPKLILMDLQLPNVHGDEILKAIKENETTRIIPVIVLSSSSHSQDVSKCYNNGANAYMVKSLDFAEYVQQIIKAADFWLDVNHFQNQSS